MGYSKEYTAYITGDNGNEHVVVIDVDFSVDYVGGIGAYEFWGHVEYDNGKPGITDAVVINAYIVHNGNYRSIDPTSWVAESALEQFMQNYDISDLEE